MRGSYQRAEARAGLTRLPKYPEWVLALQAGGIVHLDVRVEGAVRRTHAREVIPRRQDPRRRRYFWQGLRGCNLQDGR